MLKNILNIEEKKRMLFKRHFIRNVILELVFDEFNKDILLSNKELLKDSFKELGFTKAAEIKHIEFRMSADKDEAEQIVNDGQISGLLLLDENRRIKAELISNRIIAGVYKYLNFDIFADNFVKLLDVICKVMPDINKINSIKLSKQNTIISTDTKSFDDLTYILNEPFLASIRTGLIPFENFEYTKDEFGIAKENYKCIIGSSCSKRETKGEYAINLNIAVSDNAPCCISSIRERLQDINSFVYSVFSSAASEQFKAVMNEEV